MTMIPWGVVIAQLAAGAAQPQTPHDVKISVRSYSVSGVGGEKSGVSLTTGAVVVGRAAAGTFSATDCGSITVSTGGQAFEWFGRPRNACVWLRSVRQVDRLVRIQTGLLLVSAIVREEPSY